MKRGIWTALLGLVVSVAMEAGVLTEQQTRDIARNFRQSGARSVVEPSLVYAGESRSNGARIGDAPAFYVYNYGFDDGFVIVSAEDAALPILAFSDKGQFAIDEQMPVQVASWLDGYCDYIEQVRSGSRYVEPAPDLGCDITIAIAPLMKAQWDQGAPYNNLCPPYDEAENCATGCAATAIAQIMHHHAWPDTGEGSVTFAGKVIDFSQSHYDWPNMLDTYGLDVAYTEAQTQAVAKLMYDVGVAAEMQYGYESGAQNVYIYRSLYTHFKYSKQMRYVVRNTMTTAEWKQLIREELDAGRPVYYGGFAEDMSMGHAFVCDGIDETNNYFHFNWGWSGHCNGFYFLNNLNPPVLGMGGGEGNFNADHVAIVGIQPAQEGEADELDHSVLMMRKGFYSNTSRTSLGKNFYVQVANVWNLGPESVRTRVAIGMYDKKDSLVNILGKPVDFSVGAFFGKSLSIPISLPAETETGEYELRVVYETDSAEWSKIIHYHDSYQYVIYVEVDGNSVTLESLAQSEVNLQATLDRQLPSTLLPGKEYSVKINFENVGSWNFDGRIGCRLLQLPEKVDGPQSTIPDTDTLVVMQNEASEMIYSEDSKALHVGCRLNTPADYLLQAYYIDPLSRQEVSAGEWALALAEPAEEFSRRVVMEQTWHGGDHRAMQELKEAYPDHLIGMTVVEMNMLTYVDSLDLPEGKTVLMNRVRNSGLATVGEAEPYLKEWLEVPAMASLDAKAKYVTQAKDSVEMTLTTRFAYAAEGVDMRLAVVALARCFIDGGDGWNYSDWVIGCFPDDAWSGVSGHVPSTVVVGEEYTYTLTLKPNFEKELTLVGLLIDGETGEICNAVALHQDEIAPMEGAVQPTKVNIGRTAATMNTGLHVELPVSVYPTIASQEVVWTSSNPEVATFNNGGQLETLAPGVTTLRAASVVNPEVYAEMQLTVQKADFSQVQHVEAGYLHYLVDFDSCPDKLILGGEINGTDIALLRTLSGGDNVMGDLVMTLACPLDSLDLSQCRIVKGGKPYYMDYVTEDDVVGREMFKWCLFLKEIVLPANLVAIGDNAFAESGRGDMKSIEIPATVKTIGYAPFRGCQGFESFSVAEGNTAYKSVDGVLYNYAGTELVAYPAAKPDTVYEAIETLTRILPYAFNEAWCLKEFRSNLRLSSLGYGAFYHARSLETVSLGNRLNNVEEYAFAECTALKSLVCKRVSPAECADNAFEGVPETCVLDLPEGYSEDYTTASGWRYFTHVSTSVEELPVEASVRVAVVDNTILLWGCKSGGQVAVYTPTGVQVASVEAVEGENRILLPTSGIYIVRSAGFNAKVVVK